MWGAQHRDNITMLHWNQERQRLLAENVANADTPEFKPSDLAPPKFDAGASGAAPLTLLRTSPAHLASSEGAAAFDLRPGGDFEVVPTGNGVSVPYYARAFALQDVSMGSYSDTLIVTFNF